MNAIVPAERQQLATSLTEYLELAKALAGAGIFGSPSQVLVKILCGKDMGFGPVASLTDISISEEGKIIIGAHLRAAQIRASGRYDYRVLPDEHTEEVCAIEFLRRKGEDWVTMGVERLTMVDAKKKGMHLTRSGKEKPAWRMAPKNLLHARCMTNGYRFHCPDLSCGVSTYDPDEMESGGEVVDAEYTVEEKATVNGTLQKIEVPAPAPITQTARQAAIPPVVEMISGEQQDALAQVFRDRKRTPADMQMLLDSRGVHTLQQLPRDLYEWAHDILAQGQIDQAQSDRIAALVSERGFAWQDIGKRLEAKWGVNRLKLLTRPQADYIEKALQPKEGPA